MFFLSSCNPAGLGEAELKGVCFRFSSDLDFVVYNKKIYSIADFLHYACTVHGVAEVELTNHTLTPKMYPVESCLIFVEQCMPILRNFLVNLYTF